MNARKMVVAAVVAALMAVPLVAQEEPAASQKALGLSVGARLSVLGVEPTVSVMANHLEVEAFCPLRATRGYEEVVDDDGTVSWNYSVGNYVFGYAPGVSIGYNSKPFGTGWQNGVGLAAIWLTNDYLAAVTQSATEVSDDIPDFAQGAYLAGLYYRGGIQWKSGFELYFRMALPLAAYVPSLGKDGFFSVLESEVSAVAIPATFLSTALGVRFTF